MHRPHCVTPRAAFGLLLTLFMCPLLACAGREPPPDENAPPGDVSVAVSNDGTSDADIFAVRLGTRVRIGFVPSHSTAILRVPSTALDDGDLRLLVHRIGEPPDYYTSPMRVEPGERALLDVAPEIQLSSFALAAR